MPSARWSASSATGVSELSPHTIAGINALPEAEKRAIYFRLIPAALLKRFGLDASILTPAGRELLFINCLPGSPAAEMALYHQPGFPDPILYGQIVDTLNGQLHILLYILNNPDAPRFNVDCLPDGTSTNFGTTCRNLEAEQAALQAGLTPGQVRRGLRLVGDAIGTFEQFVTDLGHELYFAEPLHYHNAVIFEQYGFAYEKGRRLMERIQQGFAPGGAFARRLDGSTPFRQPQAAHSIRLRSWAIHDGILDEPFTGVTMYKVVGASAGINTAPNCPW